MEASNSTKETMFEKTMREGKEYAERIAETARRFPEICDKADLDPEKFYSITIGKNDCDIWFQGHFNRDVTEKHRDMKIDEGGYLCKDMEACGFKIKIVLS